MWLVTDVLLVYCHIGCRSLSQSLRVSFFELSVVENPSHAVEISILSAVVPIQSYKNFWFWRPYRHFRLSFDVTVNCRHIGRDRHGRRRFVVGIVKMSFWRRSYKYFRLDGHVVRLHPVVLQWHISHCYWMLAAQLTGVTLHYIEAFQSVYGQFKIYSQK